MYRPRVHSLSIGWHTSDLPAPLGDRARWEDVGRICNRGAGQVLKVRERGHPEGDRYALKELKPGAGQTRLARFTREIEATRRLAELHPGIVPVLDFGLPDAPGTRPWYVMPLADGSLEDEAGEYLGNLDRTLELGIQLTDALATAHSAGVIHRDLKPANILRLGGVPRIADFGICFVDEIDGERITGEQGATVGTKHYVAPELTGGRGPATRLGPRADIYSLGKTLYSVLCGGAEVFPRENHRSPEWSLVRRFEHPSFEHFHGLLDRMVTADPERRFASVHEVRLALERARRAVASEVRYSVGYYGVADVPSASYVALVAILEGQSGRRRQVLANAVDQCVKLAEQHIQSTSGGPERSRFVQGPDEETLKVAHEAGEHLVAAGAALLIANEAGQLGGWMTRLASMLEIDARTASRGELILHDAAAYALVGIGGIAWRLEDTAAFGRVVQLYREHHASIIYLPLANGYASPSAKWITESLDTSMVIREAEPWVAENAALILGLVSGFAMLGELGWMTKQDRDQLSAQPTFLRDYPALFEPYSVWFGHSGQKFREAPAFAAALAPHVRVTSEADLRVPCVRVNPVVEKIVHAKHLVGAAPRDVHLRSFQRSDEWYRWLEQR